MGPSPIWNTLGSISLVWTPEHSGFCKSGLGHPELYRSGLEHNISYLKSSSLTEERNPGLYYDYSVRPSKEGRVRGTLPVKSHMSVLWDAGDKSQTCTHQNVLHWEASGHTAGSQIICSMCVRVCAEVC